MQQSPRRPPFPLHRSHLESDTYRAVLRILSHCAELTRHAPPSPPRPSPLPAGPGEQEPSASPDGAAASLSGIPGKDGGGSGGARNGDEREAHGEPVCRDSPEDGGQGLGEVPAVLGDLCPRVDDARVGNSPPGEGLGACDVPEEVCDGSRNVGSQEERPCGMPVSSDSLDDIGGVDFSSLMEELDLQEGGGTEEPVSGGLKNKLPLEDADLLGFDEACPRVDAPEHGEKWPERTRVDDFFGNVSPVGSEFRAEVVCKDPELLSVPCGGTDSVEESCTETQLKVCDSSRPPLNGSRLGELGDHRKANPMCTVEEDEMEEGEIPNEGEILDFSFSLELQDAGKEGIGPEENHVADGFAQKGNAANMVGGFIANGASSGADLIKEELKTAVHESNQHIGRVEPKPQKKKKNAKGTKKIAGKLGEKKAASNKQPNGEVGLECQKKAKNAATKKEVISGNIVSGRLSLPEVGLKDMAIESEEKPSITEDIKVQEKRKRGPLTENRKEKKKLAKKRKRAETNKKLGVKRLKLEMMSKPRKVIPCSFYQKGRCQKGDSCKFSHDIIPDTKSTPCSFFARGTCLKGDDCPFDHQLSKYPCHSYMSQGRCNRGDSCLFSHKVPVGELSSTTETDSTILSGKENLQKCLDSSNLLSPAVNTSAGTSTSGATSTMSKDTVEQMKLKQPVRMPKGICFLSFGKEPSIGINKQHHDLDLKTGDGIQIQKEEERIISGKLRNSTANLLTSPEKSLSHRTLTSLVNEDNSSSLFQKSPVLLQQNVEIKSCDSIQPLGSNTTTLNDSKGFSNEESRVADASRILEEFLFSGIA